MLVRVAKFRETVTAAYTAGMKGGQHCKPCRPSFRVLCNALIRNPPAAIAPNKGVLDTAFSDSEGETDEATTLSL